MREPAPEPRLHPLRVPAPLRRVIARRPDDRVDLARRPLPAELLAVEAESRSRACSASSPSSAVERFADRLGLRVDQARGAAARLGQRGDVGGDDRRAARHRLQHRQAEALVDRRQHERLGARVQPGQLARPARGRAASARRGPPRPRTAAGGRRRRAAPRPRAPAPPRRARARERFLRAVWEATTARTDGPARFGPGVNAGQRRRGTTSASTPSNSPVRCARTRDRDHAPGAAGDQRQQAALHAA